MADSSAAHGRWLFATSVVSLALLAAFLFTPKPATTALLIWSSLAYLALIRTLTAKPTLADLISALRVILCVLAVALAAREGLQLALFLLAMATDFLDGFVARRTGSSIHGELLDMEADQILVLSLALAIAHSSALGPAALIAPALKYVAVIAETGLKLDAGTAKPVKGDNRRAKLIYLVLLAALATGLPALNLSQVHTGLLALALPLLAFSFGADFWHKLRARELNRTARASRYD